MMTLVPSKFGNNNINKISQELEKKLRNLSKDILLCIISSKDYYFLYNKVKISTIVSCILGIEIINNKRVIEDVYSKNDNVKQNPLSDTANSVLLVGKKVLKKNSIFLEELQEQITKNYKDLEIESKYTFSKNKILSEIIIEGRKKFIQLEHFF